MPPGARSLLALAFLAPAFAGCLAAPLDAADLPAVGLGDLPVPDGAVAEALPDGVAFVWRDVPFPFEETIEVPEGATVVTASVETSDSGHRFEIVDGVTGRRRCEVRAFSSLWPVHDGRTECAALTATDALPTTWKVLGYGAASEAVGDVLRVEVRATPVTGPAAILDLSQISKPVLEAAPTESLLLESHDGTPLYVEYTLPDGEGPFPVVITASPYNGPDHASGLPSMWAYWTHDFARRGYAAMNVDVRGTGRSGGCSDVWGEDEQRDVLAAVEWAATQPWSDGNVALYGQSYPGTTALEGAVHAPEALKAVITIAPVADAWTDWHYGGVPNGEWASAPSYQAFGASDHLSEDDPSAALALLAGGCDPTLTAQATDPRGLYTDFYRERNLTARAGDVRAAVLLTQGFFDPNVKAAHVPLWFNDLQAPKLAVLGHWGHQHPSRADREVLFLGWLDEHLRGRDVGFSRLPDVVVTTQDGRERTADAWPDPAALRRALHADFAAGALSDAPKDGSAALPLLPAGEAARVVLEHEVAEGFVLSGEAVVRIAASLPHGGNAHVVAELHDGERLVSFGMFNLAHRGGHDRWTPLAPGEVARVGLRLLPTEYAFDAGDTLRLVLRAVDAREGSLDVGVGASAPGVATLHGGADGTALVLPLAEGASAGSVSAWPHAPSAASTAER